MNASDTELLRQFARDGSEAAFAELVRRYVDLVYSAALRQVGFDVQAAEDVTQAVFTDLARKAAAQTRLSTLTGWLYGSTRYEAMLHRRTESRRIVRETAAHAMSQLLTDTDPEPEWDRLQPVLDEAMCDLPENDRDAVLMRYFEKRPLAEIGLRLGLSENTARMRVDRALDKLHAALKKRGITSTAAALGTLVGAHAVASAPAEVTGRVARAAAGSWRPRRTVLAAGRGWMAPAVLALLLGVVGLIWVNRRDRSGSGGPSGVIAVASEPAEAKGDAATAAAAADLPVPDRATSNSIGAGTGEGMDSERFLQLTVLAKDTGQPVPNVEIESTSTWPPTQEKLDAEPRLGAESAVRTAFTLRSGEARVPYSAKARQLEVIVKTEGFADVALRWFPDRGDTVPATYTVRLERAVVIGGRVVDTSGKPVFADVSVGVLDQATAPKSGENQTLHHFSIATDDEGRWQTRRVSEALLMRLAIGIQTYDFLPVGLTEVRKDPEMVKALRDQTHVFVLKKGHVVRGIVVDPSGNPMAGTPVVFSGLQGGQTFKREETSQNGTFSFHGAHDGPATLRAIAREYPPKTVRIEVAEKMEPVRLVLESGTAMRLRLVNQAGEPVPDALVEHATMDPYSLVLDRHLRPTFRQRSDQDGRVFWADAPAGENLLNIFAKGYLEEACLTNAADGVEHQIVLIRPPVVKGRVIDSASGKPVSRFTLTVGWENPEADDPEDRVRFSIQEPFQMRFYNGDFRHVVKTRITIHGTRQRRFPVRLVADGYRDFISEPIPYEAGEVTLDVALEREDQQSK
jgi:RNA polymerase sigma factor (sigma-70 family)